MCPWCFVTPACPCRRGGRTHVYGPIGPALVAMARSLRRRHRRPIPRTAAEDRVDAVVREEASQALTWGERQARSGAR